MLQSGLLILTFVWALNERKRYRKADRFGKIVIEFATASLDSFYNDAKKTMEDLRVRVVDAKIGVPEARIELLTTFQTALYHVRTVVLNRVGCFPAHPADAIQHEFEQIEDEFSLALPGFDPSTRRVEVLTSSIARGTSSIITTLMQYEAELSGHRSRWWSEIVGRMPWKKTALKLPVP